MPVPEVAGQLLEYRYFIGARDAELCILLDEEPPVGCEDSMASNKAGAFLP